MRKALLLALLEPAAKQTRSGKPNFDGAARMALFEEQKSMPWSAVWEYYCASRDVPVGIEWLNAVRAHEAKVLGKRGGAR